MRTFDYSQVAATLLTPEHVNLLTAIHEYRGKQALYLDAHADVLDSMLEIAKIQSTASSNRIEGIYTSDERLAQLMQDKTMPCNRSEQEIMGYRDVLATIHQNFEHITPTPNILLQLHRDLYRYSEPGMGGRFKTTDNTIEEVDALGNRRVRFRPVTAFETPQAVDRLCHAWAQVMRKSDVDQLIALPAFILDFLCIHPFNDGNGRMSRLLMLLLLYRAGYVVVRYISLEALTEQTKEGYYEALQRSSIGWHEGTNDYRPFTAYCLGIILSAYGAFAERAAYIANRKMTAAERVLDIVCNKVGQLSKRDIVAMCPDLHEGTVERALTELVQQQRILKVGAGRSTGYVYNTVLHQYNHDSASEVAD